MSFNKKFGSFEHRYTRTAYCPRCAKVGHPMSAEFDEEEGEKVPRSIYWLWQGTGQRWIVRGSKNGAPKSRKGFGPHLYEFVAKEGNKIRYIKTCLRLDCGVETHSHQYLDKEGKPAYTFYPQRLAVRRGLMDEKDWDALIHKFRGKTGYRL